MRSLLSHLPLLQYENLITVVNRPQTVGHEYARALLLLQHTIDVLQQRLFGVRVEGRSLHVHLVSQLLSSVQHPGS